MGEDRVVSGESRYETRAYCKNCAYAGPVRPLVGVYVYEVACPVCACSTLVPTAGMNLDGEASRVR